MRFRDRVDAGRRLAALVRDAALGPDVVVLGLPRGGVPVAFEVARALGAPLDVIAVRKLGVPSQPELAAGAIGEDGVRVQNEDVWRVAGLDEAALDELERRERPELERRARAYRGDRPRTDLSGRCAVIVDDGVATGSTARAACAVARAHGAARVVLAVPVAAHQALASLRDVCDLILCVDVPEPFWAVGEWYEDFSPTTDDEVVHLLARASSGPGIDRADVEAGAAPQGEVVIAATGVELTGHMVVPPEPRGTVVFAHGSGSGRHSPRNRAVSHVLNDAGLATLLVDLLSVDEQAGPTGAFDIELLGGRLVDVARWVASAPSTTGRPVGYFGASTGAAVALWAAAELGSEIAAVVSRGGRPDLATPRLGAVTAPTLLIVGGADDVVLGLNRDAQSCFRCECRVTVVRGATHLFEEPGTLAEVATLARSWFLEHFPSGTTSGP